MEDYEILESIGEGGVLLTIFSAIITLITLLGSMLVFTFACLAASLICFWVSETKNPDKTKKMFNLNGD